MKRSQMLIIDENPTHQKLASLMAQREGIEPVVVSNTEDALKHLNSHSEVRFVLMDLEIPRAANAAKCVKALHKMRMLRKLNFAIIASSAYAMDNDKRECLRLGADDTLAKPYTSSEFREVIRKHNEPIRVRLAS